MALHRMGGSNHGRGAPLTILERLKIAVTPEGKKTRAIREGARARARNPKQSGHKITSKPFPKNPGQ